ncbi:MAG: NADH-quinone oxidoreductase subunit J [Planctomycetes bacterium]|nr:NADH-quinone oxidoreductase subunit J [Planctomycetota bacterium]
MNDAAFLICAALTTAAAALCVTRKNPIYGAFYLLGFFLGLAGLFVLLAAPFVAAVQVIVYVGAILVLFLFVIMLLDYAGLGGEAGRSFAGTLPAALLAFLLLAGLGAAVYRNAGGDTRPPAPLTDASFGSTRTVAKHLYIEYPLALELVTLLLMAALVGAVVLTRRPGPERGSATPDKGQEEATHGSGGGST